MQNKIYKLFVISFLFFFNQVSFVGASSTIGTILYSNYYTAQLCENSSCSQTDTSTINFGRFGSNSNNNVTVKADGLSGYIWSEKFGWAVLDCANTTSGCSSSNGNFKVANDGDGNLSGYAWGETSGWINFGPFLNNSAQPVTINSEGEFNGYAWVQNFGWIKFDCSLTDYCVKTDWRKASPISTYGQIIAPVVVKDNLVLPTYPMNQPDLPIFTKLQKTHKSSTNTIKNNDLTTINTSNKEINHEEIIEKKSFLSIMKPKVSSFVEYTKTKITNFVYYANELFNLIKTNIYDIFNVFRW